MMRTIKLFDAVTIEAGQSAESAVQHIQQIADEGRFSIYLELTGDGTAKVEYVLAHDGDNYLTPTSATDIAADFTSGSGPGTNGKDIFQFSPELAPDMKIKITETGSLNSIIVTVILAVQ